MAVKTFGLDRIAKDGCFVFIRYY